MFIQGPDGFINAKVAYWADGLGQQGVESAMEGFFGSPPAAQVRAEQKSNGWVFVLQPKQLTHLTPRFHLFAGIRTTSLLEGADAVVIVGTEIPEEDPREHVHPETPILLETGSPLETLTGLYERVIARWARELSDHPRWKESAMEFSRWSSIRPL